MLRNNVRLNNGSSAILGLCLGGLLGFISWGQGRNPALAILVPFIWMAWRNPYAASMWALGYFLISTRGVISASDVFFFDTHQSLFIGLMLWSMMSGLLSLPWIAAAFYRQRIQNHFEFKNGMMALVILTVTILPPLGMIGAVSPIFSLGWLMPGSGWAGILVSALAIWAFPYIPKQGFVLGLLSVWCLVVTPHREEDHSRFDNIKAISTQWGKVTTIDNVVDRMGFIAKNAKMEARNGTKAVIYPEGILGDWHSSYDQVWKWEIVDTANRDKIEIGVGTSYEIRSDVWTNTLAIQSPLRIQEVSARQTIPYSMYQPWHDAGYPSDWGRSSSVRIAGHEVVVLFCYEEHLPGIFLSAMLRGKPEAILAVSNAWWGRGSVAPVVQLRHSESMARLFGLPLLRAENTSKETKQ